MKNCRSTNLRFPKPEKKKKRKHHKPSILQEERYCYLCEKMYGRIRIGDLQTHHIFGGPDRDKSEAEGMKVFLCLEHHTAGPEAVHRNHEIMRMLKQEAQRAYEQTHTRDEFMEKFGRNYLED